MFGLGEEIGGDEGGIRAVVGDDDRLGGAVDRIDADIAVDLAFGKGDEATAGAEDLVDGGDGLSAVGQSGDGLRASDFEDGSDSGDLSGDQFQRGDLSAARSIAIAVSRAHGARDADLVDAGHLGGYGRVQHR